MGENTMEEFRQTVREQAETRAEQTRQELGPAVLDATERYFPEAVRERRQRDVAGGFVAGLVVGAVLRHVVGR